MKERRDKGTRKTNGREDASSFIQLKVWYYISEILTSRMSSHVTSSD